MTKNEEPQELKLLWRSTNRINNLAMHQRLASCIDVEFTEKENINENKKEVILAPPYPV